MNIGIITQPLQTNYGGLLQNYALQTILKRMGHNVVTLDQDFRNGCFRTFLGCIKTFIIRLLCKGKSRNYPVYLNNKQKQYIRQYTNDFINKYIVHSKILDKVDDFRSYTIKNGLNALIVGSDQVWRPLYNKNIYCSFLDFAKGLDLKRIVYAASFGVDKWEFTEKQTLFCKELLKDFDAVSVRERSGVSMCKKYFDYSAMQVLDPTMLLDKEDYITLMNNENENKSKGDLFTYLLDESQEKKIIVSEIEKRLKLTSFSSMPIKPITYKNLINLNDCIFPPVTKWIRSFYDAKFVVCDSFHGAVFSIIFNKPFLIIGNEKRGMSRFISLLEIYGLENRIITSVKDDLSIINTSIDWKMVNEKRKLMKEQSMIFLNDNLNR